ncbi:predicted protein [Sclerotinia sclerotiorum 1980 UF-70]|uniref:Uncharacterized protein n=1 Tax=Sclerotinia sclerotiorum (strain ATCC 18683 / 1980 / Ss-1) TaxID=665079 RepID=A7E4D8_SCLS1|nr:predicted protein [Sclerotinia sclerotiorum 1980 UF-70]EDN90760.1 predicted protein [Sclerotinia sclerotiorum 1980 UF-70]
MWAILSISFESVMPFITVIFDNLGEKSLFRYSKFEVQSSTFDVRCSNSTDSSLEVLGALAPDEHGKDSQRLDRANCGLRQVPLTLIRVLNPDGRSPSDLEFRQLQGLFDIYAECSASIWFAVMYTPVHFDRYPGRWRALSETLELFPLPTIISPAEE